MRRLGPGVYDDGEDGSTLHLDLGELLTAYGYADTPQNRDVLEATARDMFGAIRVPVERIEHGDDWQGMDALAGLVEAWGPWPPGNGDPGSVTRGDFGA